MGREVWTSNDGKKLFNPWPERVPVHGAHVHTRPTMLVLDGHQLRVTRVVDSWEEGHGVRGTGWKVELEDGRGVVVFQHDHVRWFLAS